MFASLFDKSVSYCVATADMYASPLWKEEGAHLVGAVEKRRREFAAGRAAARRALERIGVPPAAIQANPDRTPRWPSGVVGSISHCDKCCAAVVAHDAEIMSLGLDLEVDEPLSDEMLSLICDLDEISTFASLKPLKECGWGKMAFCAKEAFYKCYYPIANSFLDFSDVSIRFTQLEECNVGEFFVTFKCLEKPNLPHKSHLIGRWAVAGGIVFAGATLKRTADFSREG